MDRKPSINGKERELAVLPIDGSASIAAPPVDSVVLSYLDDCEAVVLHPSSRATLVELTRSRIALAPVGGLVTVTGCTDCDISVSCARISVSNSRDCRFYLRVAGGVDAVAADEDSSGLRWAPYNVTCGSFGEDPDAAVSAPSLGALDAAPAWSAHAPAPLLSADDDAALSSFGREKARELYRALVTNLAALVEEETIGVIAATLGLSTMTVCMHVAPPSAGATGTRLDFCQFEALLAKRAPSADELATMLGALNLSPNALPTWTLDAGADDAAPATATDFAAAAPTAAAAAAASSSEVVTEVIDAAVDAAIAEEGSVAAASTAAPAAAAGAGAAAATEGGGAMDPSELWTPPSWTEPTEPTATRSPKAVAKYNSTARGGKAKPQRKAKYKAPMPKQRTRSEADAPQPAWGAGGGASRRTNSSRLSSAMTTKGRKSRTRRPRSNYDFEQHLHLVLKTPGYAAYLRQKLGLDPNDGVVGGATVETIVASKFQRTLNRAPFNVDVTKDAALALFKTLRSAQATTAAAEAEAAVEGDVAVESVEGEGDAAIPTPSPEEEETTTTTTTTAVTSSAAPPTKSTATDSSIDAATLRRYLVQLKRSAKDKVGEVKRTCAQPISTWDEWREKKVVRRKEREVLLKLELKKGLAGEMFSLGTDEMKVALKSWALLSEEQVVLEIDAIMKAEMGKERACSGCPMTKENEAKLRSKVTEQVTSSAFDLQLLQKFVGEKKLNVWPLRKQTTLRAGAARADTFQEWLAKRNESRRRQQEEVKVWLEAKQLALRAASEAKHFVVVAEYAKELGDIIDQSPCVFILLLFSLRENAQHSTTTSISSPQFQVYYHPPSDSRVLPLPPRFSQLFFLPSFLPSFFHIFFSFFRSVRAGLDAFKGLRLLRLLGSKSQGVATRKELDALLGPTLFTLNANVSTKQLMSNLDVLWCSSRQEAIDRAVTLMAKKEEAISHELGEWESVKEAETKLAHQAAKTAEEAATRNKEQRTVAAQAKFDEWKAALKAGE